jgi:hypothetical protein
MTGPSLDRKSHEEHWRQRLRDVELRLTFARQYFKDIQGIFPPLEKSTELMDHSRFVMPSNPGTSRCLSTGE